MRLNFRQNVLLTHSGLKHRRKMSEVKSLKGHWVVRQITVPYRPILVEHFYIFTISNRNFKLTFSFLDDVK